MKLSEGIQKTLNTKWSFINTFDVQFVFNDDIKEITKWVDDTDGKNLNLHIINIDTPEFTNQAMEAFIGNRFVIQNGRDELYRITITFRDSDNFNYYRKFVKLYQATRENYFDSIKFTIIISKDADWYGQIDQTLFSLEDCIMENVSKLNFSNATENQIGEFSITIKVVKPVLF